MKKIINILLAVLILVSSVSVAAEVSPLQVEVKNAKMLDITKPAEIKISAGDGFEGATISVEDDIIYTLDESGAGEYILDDVSLANVSVLGDTLLTVSAKFGNETISVNKEIYLIKFKSAYEEKCNIDFETYETGNEGILGFSLKNASSTGASLSVYERAEGDKAMKINYTKDGSSPYVIRTDKIEDGSLITLQFDIYFSAAKEYFKLEIEDGNSKYGLDGAGKGFSGVYIFSSGNKLANGDSFSPETWYTVKVDMNSVSGGLDIYVKGGDYSDFVRVFTKADYYMNGYSKPRLMLYIPAGNGGGYCVIDNYSVKYLGSEKHWYVRGEFADSLGGAVSADNVSAKGGKVKIKFSEAMKDVDESDFKLINEVGNELPFTGSYDEVDYSYTLTANDTLRAGGEYKVLISESLLSNTNATSLTDKPISFKVAKNVVSVASVAKEAATVTVKLNNAAEVQEGMVLVAAYYQNGLIADINFAKPSTQSEEYTLSLVKPSGDSEFKAFILNNINDIFVNDIYR